MMGDDGYYHFYLWDSKPREGGSVMSHNLNVVLTWAERIAKVIIIMVPAFRAAAREIEAARTEAKLIRNDEE